MTFAPMAAVSALRETSVIIAALIGTRLLREPFGTRRVLAASAVAVGVVLLQVSRAA
jgi:drug/metabolite transporter (DMT)-like permease